MNLRTRAIWAGILASSFWGGLFPAIKVVMAVLPPFVLLTVRFTLAIALLLPFVFWKGGFHMDKRTALKTAVVGALGFGFTLGIQFVGTNLSTAANGALVTTATPAFVVMFGALLLHERMTRRQAVALVLATLGVLVVMDLPHAQFDAVFWGNVALLAAALGWALYSVLVRWLTRTHDTLEVSVVSMAGGLPVVAPLALLQLDGVRWADLSWGTVWGVLYVAIFATALAMFLWNYAFTHLETGAAALTFFAQPLVGTLISVLFLGERLTVWFVLGGAMLLAGMYLASTSPAAEPSTARAEAQR